MLLEGQNAIVTGSSRGIGKAIALRFAEEGANVVVNYLGEDGEARSTIDEVRARGVKAVEVQADVGSSDDVRRLVDTALDELGSVDILVNNAGMGLTKPFETIGELEWERMIAVHLKGVFLATQLAGQAMRRRGAGSVINISSVAGKVALPHRVIYSAVQAGKMMFTSALACEWARWGIRVNAIAPGTILTDLVRRNFDLGLLDGPRVLERTPLGRFGETAEVASVAAFLASKQASYVTGQTIFVDGGWSCWAGWELAGQKT
ncbi:MAG TPA: glucose 1-dehydrogenase [Candidatus Acidoferrales bacterium]|nr:glucose 1-dehydrogenase [Candidatus Acidoferrales bacterium]